MTQTRKFSRAFQQDVVNVKVFHGEQFALAILMNITIMNNSVHITLLCIIVNLPCILYVAGIGSD